MECVPVVRSLFSKAGRVLSAPTQRKRFTQRCIKRLECEPSICFSFYSICSRVYTACSGVSSRYTTLSVFCKRPEHARPLVGTHQPSRT